MKLKHDWLERICELCDEYRQLEGLQDALRASQITDEILDIVEEELNR